MRLAGWPRVALLAALGLLAALLLPRAPAKVPFDPTWRARVAAEQPGVLVLGNCLASQFDEAMLAELRPGRRALRISAGGTFAAEWYLVLAHSVFPVAKPDVIVVPFVGDELDPDPDLGALRRAGLWIPDDAPPDPVWDILTRQERGPLGGLRAAATRALFRPAAAGVDATNALAALAFRVAAVPASAVPSAPAVPPAAPTGPAAPAGPDVPRMGGDDSPVARWRSQVVAARLGQDHFRPGFAFERDATEAATLPPEERLARSFLPAILDLVEAHGARLLLVRAQPDRRTTPDPGADAFLAEAARALAARGHVLLDVSAEAPTADARAHDPRGAAEAFTRSFTARARAALP